GVDAAGDVRVRDRRDLNRTFGGDDVHDFLVIKKRYGSAALQIIEVDLSKCTPVFDGRVKNTRSPSGMMSQPSSSDGNTRVTCRFAVAPSPVVEAYPSPELQLSPSMAPASAWSVKSYTGDSSSVLQEVSKSRQSAIAFISVQINRRIVSAVRLKKSVRTGCIPP